MLARNALIAGIALCAGLVPDSGCTGSVQTPDDLSVQPPAPASTPAVEPQLAQDQVFSVGGAEIDVVFTTEPTALSHTELRTWVSERVGWVARYHGRFPVPRLKVEFVEGRRPGIGFGQAFDGRHIQLHIGRQTQGEDIVDDWVFVHEMLHLGFPFLDRRHRWMREGLSTYIEPIIRARAGNLSPDELWRKFTNSMPQGLPQSDDRGLDRTHTWANVYWGGALFWLYLDVSIRRETGGQHSVDDLLRALVQAGMDARQTHAIEAIFPVARTSTGTHAFERLYLGCATSPLQVDLDALWRELGLKGRGENLILAGDPATVGFRDAITQPWLNP